MKGFGLPLTSKRVCVLGRRVVAARKFMAFDREYVEAEMLADAAFGFDDHQVSHRHHARSLLFIRACRPSNRPNIAALVASVTQSITSNNLRTEG